MFTHKYVGEQNVVCPFDEAVFNHYNEQNTDNCYYTEKPGGHYFRNIWPYLYKLPKYTKPHRTLICGFQGLGALTMGKG